MFIIFQTFLFIFYLKSNISEISDYIEVIFYNIENKQNNIRYYLF